MSMNKAIKAGKEKRKQYRKSKAFDTTCRNHGSCKYCEENRLHSRRKSEIESELKLEEELEEDVVEELGEDIVEKIEE